jgi:hypothetical protein
MEVTIIYTVLKDLIKLIKPRKGNQNQAQRNRRAIIRLILRILRLNEATRNHIANSDGDFVRSQTLSNGYIALKQEMEDVNPILGDVFPEELLDMLGRKAMFWDSPQTFVENQPLRSLIPTLQEIDELCEELLYEL